MNNEFRAKAIEVIWKQTDGFHGGGCFFDWTADERETWRRINEMDPLDRFDLQQDAHRLSVRHSRLRLLEKLLELSVTEETREFARRGIESIDSDLDEHEKYKAEAKEVFRRSLESGSPEDWVRWVLGQHPFIRPISPDDPTEQASGPD